MKEKKPTTIVCQTKQSFKSKREIKKKDFLKQTKRGNLSPVKPASQEMLKETHQEEGSSKERENVRGGIKEGKIQWSVVAIFI